MNTCSTCTYWIKDKQPARWGTCGKAFSGEDQPNDPTTLAFALACYEDGAMLMTQPDFGCIMHEPKP